VVEIHSRTKIVNAKMKSEVFNMDCVEAMKAYPDNYFELAIVDPPYGIGASGKTYGKRKKKHIVKDWDNETPDEKYFEELFRVSKNQIIWGGNYFDLPLTNGWIIWDKDRQKETTFSDGEMGWTSFLSLLKITKLKYDGFLGMDSDGRIHPTQKPIKLYKWLLMNYAKPNDKILDTHLGSGSIAIACYDLGFDLTACELDTDYFNSALKRLENHKLQLKIF
jgi:site-specific DNA-methyltransferase (adenine-specific)